MEKQNIILLVGGGDKDSRDLLQMRIEKQWRKGNDIDLNQIGGFEKHTKGFGGQMMRKICLLNCCCKWIA